MGGNACSFFNLIKFKHIYFQDSWPQGLRDPTLAAYSPHLMWNKTAHPWTEVTNWNCWRLAAYVNIPFLELFPGNWAHTNISFLKSTKVPIFSWLNTHTHTLTPSSIDPDMESLLLSLSLSQMPRGGFAFQGFKFQPVPSTVPGTQKHQVFFLFFWGGGSLPAQGLATWTPKRPAPRAG